MAAITPVAVGTAGYLDPIRGSWSGVRATTETILANCTAGNARLRYSTALYYFASVADEDTWTSGIANIKMAFWAGDKHSATVEDHCNVALLTAATGEIIFTNAATANGYLLLLIEEPMGQGAYGRSAS